MADANEPTPAARPADADNTLLTGPIGITLFAFALPTLGSSVLQSLSGSINSIWVGRFLGESALAATANGNIVMFLLLAFVFGFGMASTILIGQAIGRGERQGARRIIGTALGTFVPAAIVLSVLGWFFAPVLLDLLGTPDAAVEAALAYLRVIFVALPAMLTFTLLAMALRGTGDSLTPLWFMGLSALLDSGLNPLLIAGLGPFPELGIAGAALATAIANLVSLPAMIVYLYWRRSPLRLEHEELSFLRPDPAILKTVVFKGLPIGLQMIVISSAALTMLRLVNAEGVDTAAAYSVVQQLWTYVQMPAMAIGAAVSAMAAQNIGAGQWDRVGRITRDGILYAVGLTGLLVVVLTLVDGPVLRLFLGDSSSALPIAVHIGNVANWGFLAFAVGLVLFGTVRANGAVTGPLVILAIAMYPVRLGFAYGARDWLGEDALWWSFPVGMMSIMLMAIWLYTRGSWREASIATAPTPHECEQRSRGSREPAGSLVPA